MKVLRYEIKNITPPKDVLAAMEKQMRAEREKRATILNSEGARDSAINTAEGEKQQVIRLEARKQQQINEAEGQGAAILTVADRDRRGNPPGRRSNRDSWRPGGSPIKSCRTVCEGIRKSGKNRAHDDPASESDRRCVIDRYGNDRYTWIIN